MLYAWYHFAGKQEYPRPRDLRNLTMPARTLMLFPLAYPLNSSVMCCSPTGLDICSWWHHLSSKLHTFCLAGCGTICRRVGFSFATWLRRHNKQIDTHLFPSPSKDKCLPPWKFTVHLVRVPCLHTRKKKQEINSRYVDRKWEGERGRIAMHFLNPFRNFEISSNKNSRVYFRTEISKSQ